MLALQGYYDGSSVKTLEKINAKKNQKVIITVLDEFIDEIPRNNGFGRTDGERACFPGIFFRRVPQVGNDVNWLFRGWRFL